MSRLLWFVLGGVATAVGAGLASVMLDDESEGDTSCDAEDDQEAIALGDGSGEPPEDDRLSRLG